MKTFRAGQVLAGRSVAARTAGVLGSEPCQHVVQGGRLWQGQRRSRSRLPRKPLRRPTLELSGARPPQGQVTSLVGGVPPMLPLR